MNDNGVFEHFSVKEALHTAVYAFFSLYFIFQNNNNRK